MSKKLRSDMPWVTSIIDEFRADFSEAGVDNSIRAGIAGQPTFFASENGITVGTRAPQAAEKTVSLADTLIGPFNAPQAQQINRKAK